jgi:hypothetical protein
MKTVIAKTTKGHRIWLQDLNAKYGWHVGARYSVTYTEDAIFLQRDEDNGKRKVSKGKGGVIDLTSKKVTAWAQGSTSAYVAISADRNKIVIMRD